MFTYFLFNIIKKFCVCVCVCVGVLLSFCFPTVYISIN